jgi:phenylalanyl-tRNA synthetase alpha chain
MKEKIIQLSSEIKNYIIKTKEDLESYKLLFLVKKGKINTLFAEFKNVPNEDKKEIGQLINKLKIDANTKYSEFENKLNNNNNSEINIDFTRSAEPLNLGTRHPISITRKKIIDIFAKINFSVAEGPEIEDDYHVFSALNFPPEHPARDMQDTFFVNKSDEILLRTHTSSVQVRVMKDSNPPIRKIMPGRVFRNEAISARAHCIFHQVEGIYINENVSFKELKETILFFAKELFGEKTEIRLRPSYFPFTEPCAEVDVNCTICKGKGCNVCKYTGWLEIMGCGMIDPNVLDYSNINSNNYSGFAFGMGIERIAMLLYQVNDLRLYFENDVRFLKQFKAVIN